MNFRTIIDFTVMIGFFLAFTLLYSKAFAGGIDQCEPTVVTKVVYRTIIKEVPVKEYRNRRNHLQLLVGNGPDDELSFSVNNNTATAVSDDENLIGVSYSRDFFRLNRNHAVSIGGFYLSNETVGLSIGWSY